MNAVLDENHPLYTKTIEFMKLLIELGVITSYSIHYTKLYDHEIFLQQFHLYLRDNHRYTFAGKHARLLSKQNELEVRQNSIELYKPGFDNSGTGRNYSLVYDVV